MVKIGLILINLVSFQLYFTIFSLSNILKYNLRYDHLYFVVFQPPGGTSHKLKHHGKYVGKSTGGKHRRNHQNLNLMQGSTCRFSFGNLHLSRKKYLFVDILRFVYLSYLFLWFSFGSLHLSGVPPIQHICFLSPDVLLGVMMNARESIPVLKMGLHRSKTVGYAPGNSGHLGYAHHLGPQKKTYHLVIWQFAMEAMAHKNRWFTWFSVANC